MSKGKRNFRYIVCLAGTACFLITAFAGGVKSAAAGQKGNAGAAGKGQEGNEETPGKGQGGNEDTPGKGQEGNEETPGVRQKENEGIPAGEGEKGPTGALGLAGQEALREIEQKYSGLRFVWDGADSPPLWYEEDGELCGQIPEFLRFVTECTGLEIEISKAEEGSAAEALLGGEAELAVGLRDGEWGGEALCSFSLCDTELVAVLLSETAQDFSAETVPLLYWGAAADTLAHLEGTVFDGHTIAFEREAQLLSALEEERVGGILLCRGAAEYAVLADGAGRLQIVPDFCFPVQQVLLLRPEDGVLCGLLERLYRAWLSGEGQESERATVMRFLAEYSEKERSRALLQREVMLWRIAGPVLLAAVLVLAVCLHRSRAALKRQRGTGKLPSVGSRKKKAAGVPAGLHQLDERIAARLVKEAVPEQRDALTGLLTEAGAMEPIREILGRCTAADAVFAYLDMDDFRSINAAYGYDTGDEMLVSFAECLKTLVFDENTVIFRKEGDRFGAFRGNLASELDHHIFFGELQSLSAQVRVGGKLVCVAYRCGASLSEKSEKAPEELAEQAAEAVACCKQKHLAFFLK